MQLETMQAVQTLPLGSNIYDNVPTHELKRIMFVFDEEYREREISWTQKGWLNHFPQSEIDELMAM